MDSQDCSSDASQMAWRSSPVLFLYLFKAASSIDLRFEEGSAVWDAG